jgi:hypothetical protein
MRAVHHHVTVVHPWRPIRDPHVLWVEEAQRRVRSEPDEFEAAEDEPLVPLPTRRLRSFDKVEK